MESSSEQILIVLSYQKLMTIKRWKIILGLVCQLSDSGHQLDPGKNYSDEMFSVFQAY